MDLDRLDHQILECLLAEGRSTYARVGDQVGLSTAAAKRRVDRLVARGVIRGFTAVVDPQVLGWNLEAHVAIFTQGTVAYDTMRQDLEAVPEVIEAFTVAGKADTVVRVVAGDMTGLEHVISRIRALPYVQQTDTTLLLSRLLSKPVADPSAASPSRSWPSEGTEGGAELPQASASR